MVGQRLSDQLFDDLTTVKDLSDGPSATNK